MEKKSTFRRTAENYQSNRKVKNGKFNVSYKEQDSTHKEKHNYYSNHSTENTYNNVHRSSQSNFALDNSRNSCKESNRKNIDAVRLENSDINKMKLLTENTIKDKNKIKEVHPKSKDVDMESFKKHKLGFDCSKINKSENSNTDLSSNKKSKVSQLKESENIINSLSNTNIDTHKRKSTEINKNKKLLYKNSNKKSTKELEANNSIVCESEKKSTKTDESDKKSSKVSSSKSEGKRKTSSNEIGVIKKKFKNDSTGIIKCDDVFKHSPLHKFPPEKYFSCKFSENQTILPKVQIKEVLSESMTLSREEVRNRKINEKSIKNLDNKINESIKAIEVKKILTKKLKDEYENKLKNLKNEYETELCRLKNEFDSDLLKLNEQLNVQEREPAYVLRKEDSSEDDSSIDDIEIIEMTEEKNIITVSSSSESESESLDSDVEVIIKSNNIAENKVDEKKQNNEINIQASKKIKRNSLLKNPIPQNADESFQLLFPSFEKRTVEPALDTILVNKQDNSFITDLKVFDNRLFVGDSHGILRQYDMKTHECVANYFGHSNIVHCIFPTASPFGIKQLFTGGYDNKILIHNIDNANVTDSLITTSPIMSICESNEIVYIGTSIGVVYVYSLRGQCFKKEFIVPEGLVCISSIKEGMKSLLFIGFKSGEISVWDADTHIKTRDISVRDHVGIPIGFVALIKQRLLVYCKNSIHFIYYASEKSPVTFNHFSQNSSLCQTKNYTIIGNNVGTIYVLRTNGSVIGKTPVVTYNNTDSPILSLTFYNNTIISGDKKGNVFFNRLIEP